MSGDPFEPELAAAAAAVPEAVGLEALDALLRLDLIRETDVPRRFRFRHPLVRRAVDESTPAGWRLGAHERAAAALETLSAPAAERAHHISRSARQGDSAAVAVLREAGEAAALRAPASAAVWFNHALRLLPDKRLHVLDPRRTASAGVRGRGRQRPARPDRHRRPYSLVALAGSRRHLERHQARHHRPPWHPLVLASVARLARRFRAGTTLRTPYWKSAMRERAMSLRDVLARHAGIQDRQDLLLIGYLACRSGYVPRLLGALIAISGLGYAADSLGAVLSQGSWTDITSFTFIGEFLLALWLLIRARRLAENTSALDQEPLTVAR